MYGKLFSSMYDGSIYGQWEAIVTFQQLIILADKDGTIEMTPQALAARTSIPLDILLKGLDILEHPDPSSRTPDEEGRRIIRIEPSRDWGWHITNYAKYRAIRTAEERREYHKQYWHKRKNKSQPDSTGTQQNQPIVEVKVEAEVDTKAEARTKPLVPQTGQFAKEIKKIFDFWKQTMSHPKSNMDEKRKALIKQRLKAGYSVDDLKSAITGCSNTPHNMGDNDRGQRYDSLELIFRTSDNIDRFMANDLTPPVTRSGASKKTSANMVAAKNVIGDLK